MRLVTMENRNFLVVNDGESYKTIEERDFSAMQELQRLLPNQAINCIKIARMFTRTGLREMKDLYDVVRECDRETSSKFKSEMETLFGKVFPVQNETWEEALVYKLKNVCENQSRDFESLQQRISEQQQELQDLRFRLDQYRGIAVGEDEPLEAEVETV